MAGDTQGARETAAALGREVRRISTAAAAGLLDVGYAVGTEAKRRTPVSPHGGILRNSQYTAPDGDDLHVVVGFGTDYALPVHEIPAPPAVSVGGRSAVHQSPGEAFFLRNALDHVRPAIPTIMANTVRKVLR
jgi:hypothetical protein